MPPRRRTTSTTRRPRVAGLTPAGNQPDETEGEGPGRTSTVTEPRLAGPERLAPEPDDRSTDAVDPPADEGRVDLAKPDLSPPHDEKQEDGEHEHAEPTPAPSGGLRARLSTVPVLAGALAVLVALAVFFGVATVALRSSPAAANTALTDVGATAEVATQLGDALETVYSYDFARLDENERAAREVITTGFSAEFDRLFAQVRQLAPQQQAVVSATITVSAVREISGDRAVLVAFMDQQATTAANAEQAAAAGRLTVTGERVDGRWKIAAVESR